jgi:two-component system, chemotaxis family, protein-glutamate methylesterase/glutaminase
MRTLLASALGGEADCVVVESGVLPSGPGERLLPSAEAAGATTPRRPLPPDVILFDLDPDEPGQRAIARALQRERKVPSFVLVAGLTSTLENLLRREGFTAVHRRPDIRSLTTPEGRAPLIELLFAVQKTLRRFTEPSPPRSDTFRSSTAGMDRGTAEPSGSSILVIGASTGGPQAVRKVIEDLSDPIPVPVAVVQHISHGFAEGFVRWLRDTTHRSVDIAEAGKPLKPDTVIVAPSGFHLYIRKGTVDLRDGERRQFQKPSADVLFESAASAYGKGVIGILLTGMGRDGAEGCVAIRRNGGITLVQDEATSVVYGMPRAAIESGAATEVLPLDQLGRRASTLLSRPRQAAQTP